MSRQLPLDGPARNPLRPPQAARSRKAAQLRSRGRGTKGASTQAALVLGSGGARGAYEVGVLRYLYEDLHLELGRAPPFSILCGTSAGALNAFGLASFTERPLEGVAYVAHRWAELRLGEVIKPDRIELLRLSRTLLGCPPAPRSPLMPATALLDPAPLRRHILDHLPRHGIEENLRSGTLGALSVTATEVATGRTTVFFQSRQGHPLEPAPHRSLIRVGEEGLRPAHALASAAIPLIFPPVAIRGHLYCDGSLRQSVPLSPALHLGADRILVLGTQHDPGKPNPALALLRQRASANPLYLLGKAVNALTLDRLDDDLERLERINDLLAAGTRAFGGSFASRLNQALAAAGQSALRPTQVVVVRPSESLGRLAADHIRSRAFLVRTPGAIGRLFSRLAEGESEQETDLVSYLLFDGAFARLLMELGYEDARNQRDELLALLGGPYRKALSTSI